MSAMVSRNRWGVGIIAPSRVLIVLLDFFENFDLKIPEKE
jgi:hypothetical protein